MYEEERSRTAKREIHRGSAQRNSVEEQARAGQVKPTNVQNKRGQRCTFSELKEPLNFVQAERAVESQKRKVPNVTTEDQIDRHQFRKIYTQDSNEKKAKRSTQRDI
ncbi:hypothetical protein F511_24405 [Dorcoceras hygrometricum]|uniref:Uncharacterized protein n=1 Tax=Dorcoceras hygrometricum TaxID=472368 RepID=A0A2Z7AJD0_9LAMI|nr:hypothetical protein F511_24405 [Dorcoceras hygrometricum]